MFETYLGLTNRDAKNASLLEKYQPDIDTLCERFSKEGLLNLMTVTDQNNDRQMKPASGIVDVISSLAENSNQIREVAIKWSAAPDMTPQTVLYRRPVA
ncbi:hypothetical protein N4678_22600, partial [Escherichia coli]|nr:hypothetical protein [Escherichia coli]